MNPAGRSSIICLVALAGCAAATAATPDGGADTPDAASADAAGPDASPEGPALYVTDRTHSPITPSVAANLRAIAARGSDLEDHVFAKVGDSITALTSFMNCFAGSHVDLDGRDELAPTVAWFLSGDAAGSDPYERVSLTAVVGWSADAAIAGDPSPLQQELAAIRPHFALVMYGTNDVGARSITTYAASMLTIVYVLTDSGVVPILSTIPPRDDSATADANVPLYNAVVRGIAQARQVPLIDYHRELEPLPDHGLGGDGVHPTTYMDASGYRACIFTSDGLRYGYNVKNLLSLQALDRVHRVVAGEAAPDPPEPPSQPFEITALPFSDVRDTTESPNANLDVYTGCGATQNEAGPEYLYRFTTAAPIRVRAMVFDRGDVDIDVHVLGAAGGEAACLMRDDTQFVIDLQPGTYWFSLDTYVPADGLPRAGEYLFVLMPG